MSRIIPLKETLTVEFKSDKKKYHYNGIKELPKDNTQDLPFEAGNKEVPY